MKMSLFDCANPIEPLESWQGVSFETLYLSHLQHHFKWVEPNEKFYKCGRCSLEICSHYLFLRHRLLNLCKEVASEVIIPEETIEGQFRVKNETDPLLLNEPPDDPACYLRANNDFGYFDDSDRTPVLGDRVKNRNKCGNKLHVCTHCPYTTKKPSHLKSHILARHTDPDQIQWFQCAQCPYRTKTNTNLKIHWDYNHGTPKYVKCDQCPFETKYKQTLKNHILTQHTDLEKIQWFECGQCTYKSKRKTDLKKHTDCEHGNKQTLKCDHCPYETKITHSLKSHILAKHTELDKIEWFECAQCPHKSKTRSDLKKHMDCKHDTKAPLKCDRCQFETKYKDSLTAHVLRKHADRSEVHWFQCEHCSFETPIKADFRKHRIRQHNEPKELII